MVKRKVVKQRLNDHLSGKIPALDEDRAGEKWT